MDLTEYLIKVLLSLGVVILFLVLVLPLVLRRLFLGVRGTGKGNSFEVKKVVPISRSVLLVELDIKGKTFILCVSERGADVIYREDGTSPHTPSGRGGPRPGEGDTPGRDQGG
ncbi:MAG: hypothetical protein Q9N34_06580 [Aquificota bacterium]|nr:hypothetical protein [Aquificota bacterium]